MEYYWLEAAIPGGVGPDADYNGMRQPRLIGTLHYEFGDWTDDDIVTEDGFWLVTEPVANALPTSGLSGWSLDDVVVTTDDSWKRDPIPRTLPTWHRLIPTGTACQDDFGVKGITLLAISQRSLDFLRQFTLSEAKLYSISEHPDDPPPSPAMIEFMRWMEQGEPS